jgi:hypothetical protein
VDSHVAAVKQYAAPATGTRVDAQHLAPAHATVVPRPSRRNRRVAP